MPGLRSIGSGYSSTNCLEVGRVQLRCRTSRQTFLTVQFRVYSRPGLHSSHLISLQHSRPTLQGEVKFRFAYRTSGFGRLLGRCPHRLAWSLSAFLATGARCDVLSATRASDCGLCITILRSNAITEAAGPADSISDLYKYFCADETTHEDHSLW